MNRFGMFALLSLAAVGSNAATIDRVVVRQQWPWSTDIDVEYRLTGVTKPVDITVRAFNGDVELDGTRIQSALRGQVCAIPESGDGLLTIDPAKAFGTDKVALADFRVKLEVSDSPENVNEALYKVFNLADGACTDVSRADLRNGRFGSYEIVNGDVIWTEVTNSVTYMTTNLVMRLVKAKNKTFRMGGNESGSQDPSISADVTLAKDYYIGVFEITQFQWVQTFYNTAYTVIGYKPSAYTGDCRPRENISVGDIRSKYNSKTYSALDQDASCPTMYPNPPDAQKSFLGNLNTKTGKTFELPSEAQWEFACRAGHSNDRWGNGALVGDLDASGKSHDANAPGLTKESALKLTPDGQGTANVGRYAPNDWGLYDMHGNVCEWCLDWWPSDMAGAAELQGAPNANGLYLADSQHQTVVGQGRMYRGGSWEYGSEYARSYWRSYGNGTTRDPHIGFRVCLPVD